MNPYVSKLIRRTLLLFGSTLAILLLAEYIVIGVYYNSHFYAHTYISGIECSNLTAEEANAIIYTKVSDYVITIKGRDGYVQKITGDSIDLSYQYDHNSEDMLDEQQPYLWFVQAWGDKNIANSSRLVYNKDKLKKCIEQLDCLNKEKVKAPKNASISTYDAKKGFTIIKEEAGNQVDKDKLEPLIVAAVEQLDTEISIEEKKCYIEPEIVSSSPKLQDTMKELNRYMNVKLTYRFGSKTEVLDRKQIGPALSITSTGKVTFNENVAEAFVKHLQETYSTQNGTWNFTNSYGQKVVVKGGNYGWKMDEAKELKEVLTMIKDGRQVERKPWTAKESFSSSYQSLGNTYVEISKQKQHMFFYKNGKLVLESDVVTGSPRGHDTPAGIFYVSQMQRNRILRGFNDDGSRYSTLVRYWMRFNGGIGLHDAPWQSSFGGRRYQYAGSHGCVNLPSKTAQKLYQVIEMYTPVIVY